MKEGEDGKKIVTEKSARVLTYVEKILRARLGATLWSALEEEFKMRRNYFHNGVVTIVLWFVLVVKRVHMTQEYAEQRICAVAMNVAM